MTDSGNWPIVQLVIDLTPWSWRVGLHQQWATTRTVVVELGPISLNVYAPKDDEPPMTLQEFVEHWDERLNR